MAQFTDVFNSAVLNYLHKVQFKDASTIINVDIEDGVGEIISDATFDTGSACVIIKWIDADDAMHSLLTSYSLSEFIRILDEINDYDEKTLKTEHERIIEYNNWFNVEKY